MSSETAIKPVIGLTGGIGSGKSLVARQLAGLGCAVIDADELAGQALDQPHVRERLQQWWGDEVIGADGGVDRKAVGRIVFDDAAELGRLERLIHPHVHRGRHELRRRHQADPACRAIVEDCPLLMEVGLDKSCDVVIFVNASREVRLRRVRAGRGWDEPMLALREKNQWPLDIKAKRADYIVTNDATEDDCLVHVRCIFSQILP